MIRDPIIDSLGVDVTKPPKESTFPDALSNRCRHLWIEVVQAQKARSFPNHYEAWRSAIAAFLRACKDANETPFNYGAINSNNSVLTSELVRHRKALVSYMDNARLLGSVKIASVNHEFDTEQGYLIVRGRAQLDPSSLPKDYVQRLSAFPWPRMRRGTKPNTYIRDVSRNVRVCVSFSTRLSVVVEYWLTCSQNPVYNNVQTFPTPERYAEFIHQLYKPIANANRIDGTGFRYF